MSEVKTSGMMTYLNYLSTASKVQRKCEQVVQGTVIGLAISLPLVPMYAVLSLIKDAGVVAAALRVNRLWSKSPEVI